MTPKQQEILRQRLLEERERFTTTLQEHRPDRDVDARAARDPGERSELELDRALDHRVALDDAHLIQKIDAALARLEEGTYGKCETCGADIGLDRLLAKPSASRCRLCQQSKENLTHVEESH